MEKLTVQRTYEGTIKVKRRYDVYNEIEVKERDYQMLTCWPFLKERQKEQVLQYIRQISNGNFPFRDTSEFPPFKPKKHLKNLLTLWDMTSWM